MQRCEIGMLSVRAVPNLSSCRSSPLKPRSEAFESLQRVMTQTLLQVLKFTIEDSVQYHHTATERDQDIQNQFGQYSDRMADVEAMMNQWATKVHILYFLGCLGY